MGHLSMELRSSKVFSRICVCAFTCSTTCHSEAAGACWTPGYTWETCCRPVFGNGGNKHCWDGANFTYDLCCSLTDVTGVLLYADATLGTYQYTRAFALQHWQKQLAESLPPLQPTLRELYADPKLGNPTCWQSGVAWTWTDCCHPRFSSTGNVQCWDQTWSRDWCCLPVLVLAAPAIWKGAVHTRHTPRIYTLEEQYLHLVEMAVTGSLIDEAGSCKQAIPGCPLDQLKPYDKEARENGFDWPAFGHTMVGHKRLRNVRHAIESVIDSNVPGDFAELGVWRGGTCIYTKALLDVKGQTSREVHLFDVFETMKLYNNSIFSVTEADVRQF